MACWPESFCPASSRSQQPVCPTLRPMTERAGTGEHRHGNTRFRPGRREQTAAGLGRSLEGSLLLVLMVCIGCAPHQAPEPAAPAAPEAEPAKRRSPASNGGAVPQAQAPTPARHANGSDGNDDTPFGLGDHVPAFLLRPISKPLQ